MTDDSRPTEDVRYYEVRNVVAIRQEDVERYSVEEWGRRFYAKGIIEAYDEVVNYNDVAGVLAFFYLTGGDFDFLGNRITVDVKGLDGVWQPV